MDHCSTIVIEERSSHLDCEVGLVKKVIVFTLSSFKNVVCHTLTSAFVLGTRNITMISSKTKTTLLLTK
eukprot:1961831-Rhodomonas_salina.1